MSVAPNNAVDSAIGALDELEGRLESLVHELDRERQGRDTDEDELAALATLAAGEIEAFAAALCDIEVLHIPDEIRAAAPSLDELLTYLVSVGRIQMAKLPAMVADLIERLNDSEYGSFPRRHKKHLESYHELVDSLRTLLSDLESTP